MYCFADTFDLYATTSDPVLGYWDSGATPTNMTLQGGRFSGSQCMRWQGTAGTLIKSSGANDAVHHISCAYLQTAALSGTTLGLYFQLTDAATNQVCIVFRSDGVILLTSATPGGTVLATYSSAVTATNTWFAFEFEVIVSATVGRFRARKNGNSSDDFDSGASLNTRPGANAYANKLTVGMQTIVSAQQIDDLLWRSDASSVPFVGDIRGYARMPASDVSTQWAMAPNAWTVATGTTSGTTTALAANGSRGYPFTPTITGSVGSATVTVASGGTGNIKAAIYTTAGVLVGAGSNAIVNPGAGVQTFIFPTPPPVTKGVSYIFMVNQDFSCTYTMTAASGGYNPNQAYSGFPQATVTLGVVAFTAPYAVVSVTPAANALLVNEPQQDGTTSYVYDATVGHADFYTIAPISSTPASTVCVVTRGFLQKSDSNARGAAVQLKSGATTVSSTATLLSSSFGWMYRVDMVDPATGTSWTPTGVNNVQIGPLVTS